MPYYGGFGLLRKVTYLCEACGATAPSYLGRCPECQGWNTFTEQVSIKPKTDTLRTRSLSGVGLANALSDSLVPGTGVGGETNKTTAGVVRLSDVRMENAAVYSSGFAELDRVLGGGILPGSYVLVGGDPGIGKSTLMLQVASRVALSLPTEAAANAILYVAGEESAFQIKLRAERLQAATEAISVLPATNIHTIVSALQTQRPQLAIIDSIQAMYCPDVAGTPGSVGQIRECAAILMEAAKSLNIAIFLVGHVTKEGAVAGPKLLEHTVDAVLYFEGDKYQNLRILRSVKNRFGSTQEIGVFEMAESGLQEIDNPSALFLSHAGAMGLGQPGSVVAAMLEGSRPLLVEIQALVGQSAYSSPRRVGNGIDANRLHQIVAVLERRLGLDFSRQDVYVNVVGGLRIDEPAADLGVAIAIISGARNLAVIPGTAVTGEIGLTGEVRPVRQVENRIREAARIGLLRMITPPRHPGKELKELNESRNTPQPEPIALKDVPKSLTTAGKKTLSKKEMTTSSLETVSVATIMDAVTACFAPRSHAEMAPMDFPPKQTGAYPTPSRPNPQQAALASTLPQASRTEAVVQSTSAFYPHDNDQPEEEHFYD
jgi:DNA repair protein RadA/Sms